MRVCQLRHDSSEKVFADGGIRTMLKDENGADGEIRTHQPLASKASASTDWATSADFLLLQYGV